MLQVSALLGAALLTCHAHAEEWERLADGRVVIVIKKIRFVLPTTPEFLDKTEVYQHDLKVRKGLRAVVDDPVAAKKWFESTDQEITVSSHNLATKGPKAFSTAVADWELQLWRGNFGFTILDDVRRTTRPDGSVAEFRRRDVSCDLRRQSYRHDFRNITTLDSFTDRRTFMSCAGPVSIGYSLPNKNFPQTVLPAAQDALVNFFRDMVPDYPLEVYP